MTARTRKPAPTTGAVTTAAATATEVVLPGVVDPGGLQLRRRALPAPGPGQALVAVEASGVSFAEQQMRLGTCYDLYLIGYGAQALSSGPDPLLGLPSIVPVLLLGLGLLGATVVTTVNVLRAQAGVTGAAALPGRLFGGAWVIGFGALFVLITAVGADVGPSQVSTLMFPAGSALVVGLLYLMGGALDRDVLQYTLGGWLALTGTAAVFLGLTGLYGVLALAIGGAYFAAAALEPRRRAAALRARTA